MNTITVNEQVKNLVKYKSHIMNLQEILEDNCPAPPAVIDNGILLDQSLLLVYGPQKSGKTFLALNFGLAIAAGKSFAIFKIPNAHKVLMLAGEGGYYPTRERIKRMCENLPMHTQENFHIWVHPKISLDNPADMNNLKKLIVEMQPRVLIIDPFIRFHHAEENSSTEMSVVLGVVRSLIEEYNLSVILLHHSGKNEYNGARGSSAILGEYDSCIQLTKSDGMLKLSFDHRHVETPDDATIEFDKGTFWFRRTDVGAIALLLNKAGKEMNKKELADACVDAGLYTHSRNAYPAIDKAKDRGEIELLDGGLYRVTNS